MSPFLRILVSAIVVLPLIGIGAVVASVIPVLIGQHLPNDYIGAAPLLACFIGLAAGASIMKLLEHWRLYGTSTALVATFILAAGISITSSFRLSEYHLDRVEGVEVTTVTSEKDLIVHPLPYAVRMDEVMYRDTTVHSARTSRHYCERHFVAPLCSVAAGCAEHLWFAGNAGGNLTPTTDCADLPLPEDWNILAQSEWLRLLHDTSDWDDVRDLGNAARVFIAADEPLSSTTALINELLKSLPMAAGIIGTFLAMELLYAAYAELRKARA